MASPKTKLPEGMRGFLDYDVTRQGIYDSVQSAVNTSFPIENERYRLEIGDTKYDGPDKYPLSKEKDAILKRNSLYRRLRGTWRLVDKGTGQVVDQRAGVIAHVPYLTPRGTYIQKGNEYTVANQMRLLSGVFARKKDNGDLEAHFNTSRGGRSFRVYMEPQTGIFRLQAGQAKIRLYPVLKGIGVSDKEIRQWWGTELHAANAAGRDDPNAIRKVLAKLGDARARQEVGEKPEGEAARAVFDRLELDPRVTERTLGKPYTHVGSEAILAATKKLLDISRGEAEVDDRDSLAFQETYSAEDLFGERFTKDSGNLARRLLWRATLNKNLKGIPSAALNPYIQSVFYKSGVSQPLEEINPIDALDQNLRVIRMGEGGIESDEQVPDEARNVQPSHFMYVDPIRSPECYSEDMEVMTQEGWVPWPKVVEGHKLACLIEGRLEYHEPEKLIRQHYRGKMYGVKTRWLEYLVTPNHRLFVQPYDQTELKWRMEDAEVSSMKPRRYMCGGFQPYLPHDPKNLFYLPSVEGGNATKNHTEGIPLVLWAQFMGWYLTEGNTKISKSRKQYTVHISQSFKASREQFEEIEALLSELPFAWCYSKRKGGEKVGFTITGKQLYTYLAQLGLCYEKYVPHYLFDASEEARRAFLDAMLSGDGRKGYPAFCSTSRQLVEGFQRIAFSLGYSTNRVFEPDPREERYRGCYVVRLHMLTRRIAMGKRGLRGHKKCDYFTERYDGVVYCATVPGGLLYVRRGRGFGHWSGNSGKVGVDARLAFNTFRGRDRKLYARMINRSTGKTEYLSPDILTKATVAFPGELDRASREGRSRVKAMMGGRIEYVKPAEVDYLAPSSQGMFTLGSNMVPFISAIKGGRLLMGAKMANQALPLQEAESPLVQSAMPGGGRSFDQELGKYAGAVFAQDEGVVTDVTPDGITVKHGDGTSKTYDLYNNFPYNRKTFQHNTPLVGVGDRVGPKQLLAKSNYTDEEGRLAMGRNLRVAYLPYKGLNFEDAVVVSEDAARKLTSEHMYTSGLDSTKMRSIDTNKFISLFPSKYNRKQLDRIRSDGVIKPGSMVEKGDPLILSVERRRSRAAGMLHRKSKTAFNDVSVIWEHDFPGTVTDAFADEGGVNVAVKAYAPAQVGDKLAGRYGDKGVIAEIVPDDDMPQDADGSPIDVMLNPLGVISRVNPAQLLEAALGKIARKRGKPYVLEGFSDENLLDFVENELKKHEVSDTETIYDPELRRKIPNVFVGDRYMMKLHHTAASKSSERGLGAYTIEGEPAKGIGSDDANPKRVGLGELTALISHGAVKSISDIKTIRGQRNEAYWKAVMQGYPPPTPGMPNTYKKFTAMLTGAGINVKKKGQYTHLTALTDRDIKHMSAGEVTQPETVRWFKEYGRAPFGDKSMDPVDGGLFDRAVTGGHGGTKWSHIKLAEPMPQPVMEEPIRALLGLTKAEFEAVISGKKTMGSWGTGARAIHEGLKRLKIEPEIARQKEAVLSFKGTRRDKAVKKLKFLAALQEQGLKPQDMMVSMVPVLPPIFRPITATEKFDMVSGSNKLYKSLMLANSNYRKLSEKLTPAETGNARLDTYRAFKAVTGLGDPISPQLVNQHARGLLKEVFGCYDDETEVLTDEGWIPFPFMDGSRQVATLNPGTHAFEWQAPTAVQHYRYQGQLLQFVERGGADLLVTPNHRMWVRKRKKRNEGLKEGWEIEEASSLYGFSGRGWFMSAASSWEGHRKCPSFLSKEELPAFAEFVGWWAAEGWIHSGGSSVELCQATRNKRACKQIGRVVAALGLPFSEGTYGPPVAGKGYSRRKIWSIKSKELKRWLIENVGEYSHGKQFSRLVLDWDSELLARLYTGYMEGDGESRHGAVAAGGGKTHRRSSLTDRKRRFVTTSCALYDGMQEVCCKIGLSVRENSAAAATGRSRKQHRGAVHGDWLIPFEGKCGSAVVDYDGHVHCVSVPNGIIYVRRRGKPVWCGNSSPKMGLYQRRLMGTSVDIAGRATITPNPSLDMDHIGMPEEMAWKLYGPWVVNRLVRRVGRSPEARSAAARSVADRTPKARAALEEEMSERPVLSTRAPALHRYSIMAFYPVLTKGRTIQLSPAIVPGFNADFDGDAMNMHVVVSKEAIKEAKEKMLPSSNLRSPSDFGTLWAPRQEFLEGLWRASVADDEKEPHVFDTKANAVAAYRSGRLGLGDRVVIMEGRK